MKFKVNDTVIITAGKDKGRTGKIIKVFPKKDEVLVEGINLFKRHRKPMMGRPGEIIDLPRPLSTAKVSIVDPKTNKATRVGYSVGKDGSKKRITRKSSAPLS